MLCATEVPPRGGCLCLTYPAAVRRRLCCCWLWPSGSEGGSTVWWLRPGVTPRCSHCQVQLRPETAGWDDGCAFVLVVAWLRGWRRRMTKVLETRANLVAAFLWQLVPLRPGLLRLTLQLLHRLAVAHPGPAAADAHLRSAASSRELAVVGRAGPKAADFWGVPGGPGGPNDSGPDLSGPGTGGNPCGAWCCV
jgi:hypothetical protein